MTRDHLNKMIRDKMYMNIFEWDRVISEYHLAAEKNAIFFMQKIDGTDEIAHHVSVS